MAKRGKVVALSTAAVGLGVLLVAAGTVGKQSRRGKMDRRGRAIAVSTGTLGIVVLCLALLFGRGRIVKAWHLHRLETGSMEEAGFAALELARGGCVEASGPIVRAIARFVREQAAPPDIFFIGPASLKPGTEPMEPPEGWQRLQFVRALYAMGDAAIPGVMGLLEDPDVMTRRLAACVLLLEISSEPFGTWAHCPCHKLVRVVASLQRLAENSEFGSDERAPAAEALRILRGRQGEAQR